MQALAVNLPGLNKNYNGRNLFVKYAYPNLSKNFFQSTAKSFWNFFQKNY